MKTINPAFITATLTALVTTGLIVLLFLLSAITGNNTGSQIGLKTQISNTNNNDLPQISSINAVTSPTTTMTLKRISTIITRLDNKAEHPREGFWRFTIEGANVIGVADNKHDRLRILVGIQSAKDLTEPELRKITQSNFDTALDARYAISQDILWAVYVHPIKSLNSREFVSAIGQTVNLAKSFGDGYSSGGILFEGGDTKDAQRYHMIEKLITKGSKV